MRSIAFFNNKGGVGKTSLVYHLAWMYSDLGYRVLAVDLDPQANLSAMFLDESRFEELWPDGKHPNTVMGSIEPLMKGIGDVKRPHVEEITESLGLLVGDLGLSSLEDELSLQWPQCADGKERAFRVISAFHRMIEMARRSWQADLILIDVGPNLGAINRAAIIASKYVVVPLSPDLFSLQGLKNLGPTLRQWKRGWSDRYKKNPEPDLELPRGGMNPIGYVIQQHSTRMDRPVKAYSRWMALVPEIYRTSVLDKTGNSRSILPEKDSDCLAMVKHYRSLMPLAMEARKPIFHLRSADGAIGSHGLAVQDCYNDFERLAKRVLARIED